MYQEEEIRKIAVYCASSTQIRQSYFDAAWRLGELFAAHHIELVFGAGKMGLMGQMADAIVANGGKMTGVIPQFMIEYGWHHPGCTTLIQTQDMAERKTTIWQMSDALVALPGGIGTLDELSEILVLKQLGRLTHPIVILNTDGYYDRLIGLLNGFIEEKFMSPIFHQMYRVVSTPEEVLPAILEQDGWKADVAAKHAHI